MAKLAPKKYGRSSLVEINQTNITSMTPEQCERMALQLLEDLEF
jgi:hypothetical protein